MELKLENESLMLEYEEKANFLNKIKKINENQVENFHSYE